MQAFLYLKVEAKSEPYHDISPPFVPAKRLKIGTFKVSLNGNKLGERFLKIVFDNAILQQVAEVYVTVFTKDPDQRRLVDLLNQWGFVLHGTKTSASGEESVLVRDFGPAADPANPMLTFPYMSNRQRKYLVPIWPEYHTELLPDSILRTEDPENFEGNKPNRNAIRKVYISRSYRRDMKAGDILVFYRSAPKGKTAFYHSVVTTLGIVEKVVTGIPTLERFIQLCRKRSIFPDTELEKWWEYNRNSRPFVVYFLHAHSFEKRPNLEALINAGVIADTASAPRGFELLSDESFSKILRLSLAYEKNLVID